MPNILIYKDREDFFKDHEHIRQLQGRYDSSDFCDRNLGLLKEKISQGKVRILLILTQQRVSKELEAFLDKCRNHINLHDALIVIAHSKWTAADAQASLMLGASYLLEEPLDLHYLSAIVDNHLSGKPFEMNIGYQRFKSPMECQVDSFGRIGRIEKKTPGNLFVETSVDWQKGDKVALHHRLASDLKQDALNYTVLEKNCRGLYYRYTYQYHLEWQKNASLEATYQAWLTKNQKQFSIPKVKLLFIVSDQRTGIPLQLGTDLYSSYLLSSSQLSPGLLERIDPQVILKERLPKLHEAVLQDWLKIAPTKKLLLEEADLLDAEAAQKTRARERLLALIIPFTKENFLSTHQEFSYLSRKSEYSRFAFTTHAEMVAISKHHLLVQSKINFSPGATLQLFLPGDPAAFYLRVMKNENGADGLTLSHCNISYLSEEQRHRILEEKVWKFSGSAKSKDASPYLPIQKRVDFLEERKRLPPALIAAAVAAVIIIVFALSQWHSTQERSMASDPNAEGGFQSNIDAFQDSVRKAFKQSDVDGAEREKSKP